jgi:glycine reductase
LPAALITSMTSVALSVGANRIVKAGRIPHPTVDPTKDSEHERIWREKVVEVALDALATSIDQQTVFET